MRLLLTLLLAATLPSTLLAQWELQNAHTTASLRGIHSIGNGVAWASGTNGTVLRTTDCGTHWQTCAIPPGAEKLDFRGIQAFDDKTAIVMSSGKGDLSRLYKTVDACQSWKLVFTNPDKDGFWDAVALSADFDEVFILGDPVQGHFQLFTQREGEDSFASDWNGHPLTASLGQAAFAASNSLIVFNVGDGMFSFVTGGAKSEVIHEEHGLDPLRGGFSEWSRSSLPFKSGESSGAFSIAAIPFDSAVKRDRSRVVAVGGDYSQPNKAELTAAYSSDWGYKWKSSKTPPHGYRSAVAYDANHKTWITVGPNGTDISIDDGRNWRPLQPGKDDAEGADRDWNALSLPFVVGPKGRIGKLRAAALAQSK